MSNSNPVGPMGFLGTPNVGNTLIARPNSIEDADGINYASAQFQWLRNGEPIPGAISQKYVLTNADLNAQISVTYSYIDMGGTEEAVTSKSKAVLPGDGSVSSYTPPVVTSLEPIPTANNSAPEGPLTILGDALVGNKLVARPNAIKDADGINYSTAKFHWVRDGDLIPGAEGQTYIVTDADRGSQISVLYSYYDNGGSYEVIASKPEPAVPGGVTSPTSPVIDTPPPPAPTPNDDGAEDFFPPTGEGINNPAIGKLVIYGFPVDGATLEARNDAVFDREGFDRDGGFYQWLRDGEPIPGATGDTFTVTSDDYGTSLSLQYTFIDFGGTVETMLSPVEAPVPYPAGMEPEDVDVTIQQPREGDGSGAATTPGDDVVTITASMSRVDGLGGSDTAIFAGSQSNYTVAFGPDGISVTDRSAGNGDPVELENFEFLDFDTELPVFNGAMNLNQFGGHTGLDEAAFESFVEMYIAYFNRAPDAVGLAFWGTAYANGMSLEDIAAEFAGQPETLAIYPEETNNFKFVSDVYQNVLGRSPDIDGLRFWSNALNDGEVGRGEFILTMLNGVEEGSSDREYLDQKTDLGSLFAVHRGMSNTDDAVQVMALFDGSEASVQDTVDAIDALYAAAMDGENGDFLMPLVGVMDDPFAL